MKLIRCDHCNREISDQSEHIELEFSHLDGLVDEFYRKRQLCSMECVKGYAETELLKARERL